MGEDVALVRVRKSFNFRYQSAMYIGIRPRA